MLTGVTFVFVACFFCGAVLAVVACFFFLGGGGMRDIFVHFFCL